MDDDFADDAAFAAALEATERSLPTSASRPSASSRGPPRSLRQPPSTSSATSNATAPKAPIQQPTPQTLPNRSAPSAILVSPRQKGNPILTHVRAIPWEYSDIPTDYVLGLTTCALFLSLKYHRLHPEYIYSRIRLLGHKYLLRVLLVMVDIENHEAALKELAKTSLINNLTLMLCWSAAEAGRYLELYKSMENAAPTAIRSQAAANYTESLVEFVTTPRSINKTDAVALVSAFGSIRAAVNARPEEIGLLTGWGEKKVQRWTSTVRENFRVRKAAKKRLEDVRPPENSTNTDTSSSAVAARLGVGPEQPIIENSGTVDTPRKVPTTASDDETMWEPGEDEEAALLAAVAAQEEGVIKEGINTPDKGNDKTSQTSSRPSTIATPVAVDEDMNLGVMAALSRLRENGR